MRRVGRIAAVAVACVLPASESPGADLTVHAGGAVPGDVTVDGVRRALGGGGVFGFRLGHGLVPLLGLEHSLSFTSSFAPGPGPAGPGEARGFLYSSNLIASARLRRTVPYVTAGLGVLRQYGRDAVFGVKPAVNYGGGVKFFFFGPLALRIDGRGHSATGGLHVFELTGGLLLRLGP